MSKYEQWQAIREKVQEATALLDAWQRALQADPAMPEELESAFNQLFGKHNPFRTPR